MDNYLTEQQVEELVNFDYMEEDLEDLIQDPEKLDINDYLNSNIDYWNEFSYRNCQRACTLEELRKTWKDQDFRLTKDQQQQYDMLMQARKERVAWFYETGRVQVGPKVTKEKEKEQEEEWYKPRGFHYSDLEAETMKWCKRLSQVDATPIPISYYSK